MFNSAFTEYYWQMVNLQLGWEFHIFYIAIHRGSLTVVNSQVWWQFEIFNVLFHRGLLAIGQLTTPLRVAQLLCPCPRRIIVIALNESVVPNEADLLMHTQTTAKLCDVPSIESRWQRHPLTPPSPPHPHLTADIQRLSLLLNFVWNFIDPRIHLLPERGKHIIAG